MTNSVVVFCARLSVAQGGEDEEGEWEDVDEDDEGAAACADTSMEEAEEEEEEDEGPSGDPALDQLRALVRETGSDALFPPLDGTALYTTLCKINHSCVPNVLVSYTCTREHGLVAVLHAVRPVAAGEELVQSYVDQHAGTRSLPSCTFSLVVMRT